MSLKKFMHPRNRYKKSPDFKQLIMLYPEFRAHTITDLSGRIKVDFTKEKTLRSLTEILLKHDFNLQVEMPGDKLVPTLPLRLNYVLWIEDLMNHCSLTEMKNALGLDIGTGAVCIYALLFANMYKTRIIGTEICETSVQTAKEHINKNNYQDLIQVIQVNGESILKGVLQGREVCHFSVCNPPFFDMNEIALKPVKKLPPRNAPTGNEKELIIEGGERAFVTKMIEESIELQEQVKVYTTMLGQKSTLFFVLKLMKTHNIDNLTWTEFCQGHTKRWGLAWTFLSKDIYNLTTAPVIRGKYDPAVKVLKKQRPAEIAFPLRDVFASFNDFVQTMEGIIKELNLDMKELNSSNSVNSWDCQIIAKTDTWTHARRKRRLAQRKANDSRKQQQSLNEEVHTKDNLEEVEKRGEVSLREGSEDNGMNMPLLVCNLSAELVDNDKEPEKSMLNMCMVFDKGNGGKNALITFREYLLNKLGVRDLVRAQYGISDKKKKRRKKDQQRMNTDPYECFDLSAEKLPRLEDFSNESNEDSS